MRDIEEISYFTLEVLDQYENKYVESDELELMPILKTKVTNNLEINKIEADLLEKILSNQLKDDMIAALKKEGSSLILEADVQSNYSDAWFHYRKKMIS